MNGSVDWRLELLTADQADGDAQRVLGKLEQAGLAIPINRLLANSSTAFRPYVLMSDALLNRGVIPPYLRECVILALAARHGGYEWEEHVRMSRDAGVSDAERAAIASADWQASDDLSAEVKTVVAAALDMLDRRLSDEQWIDLSARYTKCGALELLLIVAWWGGFVPTVLATAQHRFGLLAALDS